MFKPNQHNLSGISKHDYTNKTPTYVYLCSAPHSGSTLIACLLGAHPAISTVGEFGANVPTTQRCSCGIPFAECQFWQSWISRTRAKGIDFQLGNIGINLEPIPEAGFFESLFYYQFPLKIVDHIRDLAYAGSLHRRQSVQLALEKTIALATDLCEHQGSSVFLDTTKNPLQIRFLARHPEIRLKVIALVRDGRGVMNSLMLKEKWSPQESIDCWLWSNRNLQRAERYLSKEDVYWLHLEELCRDPEASLKSLFDFCGVPPQWPLDFSDLTQRHIIGNRMRLNFKGQVRHDEAWRTTLADEHLALFSRHAGWLNQQFGYHD